MSRKVLTKIEIQGYVCVCVCTNCAKCGLNSGEKKLKFMAYITFEVKRSARGWSCGFNPERVQSPNLGRCCNC